MAGIIGTEAINIVKQALDHIKERVDRGEVLSREEASELAELEAIGNSITKIRGNDTRNEVLRGSNLITVTDKWRHP